MNTRDAAEVCTACRRVLGHREHGDAITCRGAGEVGALPVTFERTFDGRGRFVARLAGRLPTAAGFDGTHGWRIDESGLPGALELADLEELVVAGAVWSGAWLDERGPVEVEPGTTSRDGRTVLALRARVPERGAHRFLLSLDGDHLPRRLEREHRPDIATVYGAHADAGGQRVAMDISVEQRWLVDRMRVESVARVAADELGCAPAAPASAGAEYDASVALEARWSRNHLPLARAAIDGVDLGWFLVDTGAGTLAIDERAAARVSLERLGHRYVRTADDGTGAALRRAARLRVGPVTLRDALLLELDLAPFGRAAGVPIAGVLGHDLFARALVGIDRARGVIELADGSADARRVDSYDRRIDRRGGMIDLAGAVDDRRDDLGDASGVGVERSAVGATAIAANGARWHALRFESGRPVIPVRYPSTGGERDGLFAIDTASAASLTLFACAAQDAELRGGGRATLRGVTGGAGSRARRLPWIDLFGGRIEGVDTLVTPDERGGSRVAGVIGTVGMGLLRRLAVRFDYARRRVEVG